MKTFLKWMVIVVVVLVVGLVLARNLIARISVEMGATRMTGFPLEIGSVSVGLLNGQLDLRDVKLMNPPEFHEKMFVEMPQLFIDYRLGSMLAGTPHINDMKINLEQCVVVKNEKGETNAMKLKGMVSPSGSSSVSHGQTGSQPASGKMKYRVDLLRIHVGTVTYVDYSHGQPSTHRKQLNMDVTYKDINDSTDISRLVMLTVIDQAHLPINTEDLKKSLGNVRNAAGQALKGAGDALQNGTKGFFDSLNQPATKKQ